MPTNNFGQTYNNGVKYIKVNRFDSGGLDRTDYLQQLQSLRVNYDDLGPIEYNIITTQEQNDYYVYGIQPKVQSTSSVNFEVLDYSFDADCSAFFTISSGVSHYLTGSSFTWTVNNDPLNGFTNVDGRKDYTYPITSNIPVEFYFTCSFLEQSAGQITPFVYLYNKTTNNIEAGWFFGAQTNTTVTVSGSYILSGSSNPIENNQYIIAVGGSVTGAWRFVSFNWNFTQSIVTNPATSSLTIFNPDFLDFEYNDYNALFGNAEQPQYSSKYMDIDYSTNPLTPVNFNLIISGTADKAQVQDSNYNSYAWSNIRYNGVRSTSPDFNQLTTNGGYGALSNVEQNKTYIAYFDGIGGTGPEIIGQTAYFIKWLIDENGDVVNPEPGVTALYNLIDSFEPGKNAIVRLTVGDPLETPIPTDDYLTGLHPITHVGRIATMLVTQTGSGQIDYLRTMSFNYTDGSPIAQAIANVEASWKYSGNFTTANSTNWTYFDFNAVVEPGTGVWGHPTSNDYDFSYLGGTLAANTRIKIVLTFYLRKATSNTQVNTFLPRLLKNNNTGNPISLTYQGTLGTDSYNASPINGTGGGIASQGSVDLSNSYAEVDTNGGEYYSWTTDWFDTNDNDTFQVQYQVGTGGDGFAIEIVGTNGGANGTSIKFRQENPSTIGFINGITGVTSSYWSVGTYLTGSNVSVLTASQALYSIYDNFTAIQSSPPESLAFGFSSCSIGFNPQPGDYIRFQYDKNRIHNITNVSNLDGLHLTVVPPIATSSILDNFVLYRIVNDGTYVVLDVEKKSGGSSFGGIIQPQYISKTMTDNYNNIIQNLTQKGLIT